MKSMPPLWFVSADAHIPAHENLIFELFWKIASEGFATKLIDLSVFSILPFALGDEFQTLGTSDLISLTKAVANTAEEQRPPNLRSHPACLYIEKPYIEQLDFTSPISRLSRIRNIRDISSYRSASDCLIGHTPALELILHEKRKLIEFNDSQLLLYKKYLLAADLAQQAMSYFLGYARDLPKSVVFYNDYNIQQSIRALCSLRKINCTKVSGKSGENPPNRLFVSDSFGIEDRYLKSLLWPAIAQLFSNNLNEHPVYTELANRISAPGSHTYSPVHIPDSPLREALNIPKHKTVVSYFTSSSEEYDKDIILSSLSPLSFPKVCSSYNNQLRLIEDLLDIVDSHREDVHLIVRIHPRAGKDKRGLAESSALPRLLNLINTKNLPNITVIKPDSIISSYWIGFFSDLSIVQSSSIGIELAALGALVAIACIKNGLFTSYPNSISYIDVQAKNEIERIICDIKSYQEQNPQTLLLKMREATSILSLQENFCATRIQSETGYRLYDLLSARQSVLNQIAEHLKMHRNTLSVPYLPVSDYVYTEQPSCRDDLRNSENFCTAILLCWRFFGSELRHHPRYEPTFQYIRQRLLPHDCKI